ncbi:MAG: response regulator [Burkholderiales bacterium]|nr:response regulator [Burkholderiales bacterium]
MAHILTIDDSPVVQRLLRMTLVQEGHQIEEAIDGDLGLRAVVARDERGDPPFDLIITDVNMPGIGGIELVQRVRGVRSCRTVPIVFLTTASSADMKQQGRAAGANAWLIKPVGPQQIRDAVNRLLNP